MERGIALLERTLVDGSGGFVGARDYSLIVADRCTFTCTVEEEPLATWEGADPTRMSTRSSVSTLLST